MNTVYTIAFSGREFLMVYNPKRKGWETPGGRIEDNESVKDAAAREYLEESGYEVDIVDIMVCDDCYVCAAVLGRKVGAGEFVSSLFGELPDDLAFERSEYDLSLEWARSSIIRINNARK
jgi:8-oxo-dGTP diphosphatase